MNKGIVRLVLGRIMLVEAGLLALPVIVGLIYRENLRTLGAFLAVIALLLAAGGALSLKKPQSMQLYIKEGLAIASLSWILLSFFGALPFVLSGEIPSLADAFFESASGFTTTGSSILTNVEAMSRSLQFWRSFTHFVGGMGVLVLALALLPSTSAGYVNIMKAEVPGPVFGKFMSKLKDTARTLYLIYFVMTVVLIALLMLGGLDWFDASVNAFGAAGTGGFSVKNTSIAFYNSAYIDWVLSIAMIAFGINFNLYYLILIKQARKAFKSQELRCYLGIILAAVVLICANLAGRYDSVSRLIRDVFFTVSSVITTTGFTTADYGSWPLFSQFIVLVLMFVGACAGSTGGGLKVSRVVILLKTALTELRRSKDPKRALSIVFEGDRLDQTTLRSVSSYFLIYIALFAFQLLLICLDTPDFTTAFSAVAATFNNIGPGLGAVGPTSNFAALSWFSKLLLSFGMIAGRLEIFPVLVLFMPSTWEKRG